MYYMIFLEIIVNFHYVKNIYNFGTKMKNLVIIYTFIYNIKHFELYNIYITFVPYHLTF